MDKSNSKDKLLELDKLSQCYLYISTSYSLLEDTINNIKDFLKDRINFDTDFKIFSGIEEIEEEGFANYIGTPSLFSLKKVAVIKYIDNTPGTLQKKFADLMLNSLSKNRNIVFIITSLKQKLNPGLMEAVKKTGKIIRLNPPSIGSLKKWLNEKSGLDGIKFTEKAVDILIENVNMDLGLLKKEYDKLYDYISSEKEKVINEDTVKMLVSRVYSLKVFDLVDYIGKRDKNNSLKALRSISGEEQNLAGFVTLLHRMFKCLLYIKSGDSKTSVTDYIESNLKVPSYYVGRTVSKYIGFSDNYKKSEILRIFNILNDYDINFKKSSTESGNLVKKLITEVLDVKV